MSFQKRLKKWVSMVLVAVILGMVISDATEAKLSSNNRRAAVLEAFLALNPDLTGRTNKTINGDIVGIWNYLNTDLNAYTKEKSWYKDNASVIKGDDGKLLMDTDLASYGLMDGYGRGGQCKFFVDLLLFRSEAVPPSLRIDNGTHVLPTFAKMSEKTAPIGRAQPGDVIFISNYHTALVVAVLAGDSTAGTVTSVEVIDSNFVGGDGNEIIGRHVLKDEKLKPYSIYTGVSYYSEPYVEE